MAHYLFQGTYTPEAWATLIKNPQDRIEVLRSILGSLGGRVESAYFAFGEYDVVTIVEMPDNVTMAALSLALNSGGALKAIKTTPLMPVEEALEAMKKAGTVQYQPPSS